MSNGLILLAIAVSAYVGFFLWRKRRIDTAKTRRLIESMLKNCQRNLGVEPDAASIEWLIKHPSFSAFIWDSFSIPDHEVYLRFRRPQRELKTWLDSLIAYDQFKVQYPAAAAVFDHAIRWFDGVGDHWDDLKAIRAASTEHEQ